MKALINGKLVDRENARISIMDRGFLFGDGVYEVIKIKKGIPIFFREHLERLKSSLEKARIPYPTGLEEDLALLLAKTPVEEGALYVQITRGVHLRDHFPPPDLKPTTIAFTYPYAFPTPKEVQKGYKAITVRDTRWGRCDIKTISLMGAILAKLEAQDKGAQEVLFINEEKHIREGGSTNFFVVKNGALYTAPLDNHILPGITRNILLEIAQALALPVHLEHPKLQEASTWEEAFLTGTLTGVMPIYQIDAIPLKRSWKISLRLWEALQNREAESAATYVQNPPSG